MEHPPPELIEKRRELGLDKRDEMWDGVVVIVPQPYERHQRFEGLLLARLLPLADERGLRIVGELGFYRSDNDYRVPDIVAYRPDQASERGVEREAEFVVEILSPKDMSRIKLPWYIDCGVREVLLIDRDTLAVEMYVRGDDGQPRQLEPISDVLDCKFERVDENHFRVVRNSGTQDIRLDGPAT